MKKELLAEPEMTALGSSRIKESDDGRTTTYPAGMAAMALSSSSRLFNLRLNLVRIQSGIFGFGILQ